MTNAEIQVEEYVRTIDGKIYKTDGDKLRINNAKTILFKEIRKIPCDYIPYKVQKHSSNIIDLIEAGDYVNGQKVYDIEKAENMVTKEKCVLINKLNLGATPWYEGQIKSIVTKEQFKSMEYEVGENE